MWNFWEQLWHIKTKQKNQFPANHGHPHQKRLKWVQIWNKCIHFLLVDDLSNIFIFQIISFTFNLQSTAQIQSPNLQKIMTFSISNDGIQWTLDFGTDTVTFAVNDLDQNITISSQKISLAAWQLLLSQRQEFLDNHLPRVPITPNQQWTFGMREKVLSSVGAQDLDTRSYQLTDLEDIEFNWENSQLDMDAVFRPGIDTPFFSNYIWRSTEGGISWKPHCVGWRGTKGEVSSNNNNTRVWASTRTPPPPDYWEVVFLEQEWKLYPIMFIEICFNNYYQVWVLIKFIITVFHFIITFFKHQWDMCETKTVLIVAASPLEKKFNSKYNKTKKI